MNAVLNTPQTERITLYYREGSSDKVYQAVIEPQGEGFVVNFAYGRRGSTMNTGTKTQAPVDYDTAKTIYDKLIREKMAKGYTAGPDGTPHQNTPKEDRVTGILPQLLNPIDEQEVKRLLKDPSFAMQEKFDGRRVMLRKQLDNIAAINRKGLTIGFASSIGISALKITSNFIIDGECVGDVFYAFDLLEWDGEDYRPNPRVSFILSTRVHLGKGAVAVFVDRVNAVSHQGFSFHPRFLKNQVGTGSIIDRLSAIVTIHPSKTGKPSPAPEREGPSRF